MEYIKLKDLVQIAEGPGSKIYKYTKLLEPSGLPAVVKISSDSLPKQAVEHLDLLKHCGLMLPAFMEVCLVEGKPALLMEDLFTDENVYVSPNSVRNGFINNAPEAYLLHNKLNDIANIDSLLWQMRDIANCTSGKGIGLDMDMISFGVQRGNKYSDVYYKLVDIEVMQHDDSMLYQLREANVISAQEAIYLFVKYFVEGDEVKKRLMEQIKSFDW